MHMLKVSLAHLPRRPRASINMIQLLLARAEGVRVSLELRNLSNNVKVLEARNLNEPAQRRHSSELVQVAGDDNRGVLVLLQDLGDEAAGDFGLADTAVDAAVDWRTGVALEGG